MHNQPTPWCFDRIAAQDARRAGILRAAPSPLELMIMVSEALRAALSGGNVRVGFDESGLNIKDLRVVIQFHVGQQLFDWFFNAWTGYRAQFRDQWENGLSYNNKLVNLLRREIEDIKGTVLPARRLSTSFEDHGPEIATVGRILTSLDPMLSKVWFCKRLIQHTGVVSDLPVDLAGPRLVFDEYDSWAAPFAEESYAWLDLKGAFVGNSGLYQIKDPVLRAKDIQQQGSA